MWKELWNTRSSWIGYAGFVIVLHVAGLAGLIMAAPGNPAFWGLGILAYSLGLRHAFDVDHIAAIDNTVRKLVQQKRNPLGVGFYFSLGHSSVVFLMVLAVALSVQWVQNKMPQLQEIGGVIGATVSGSFLVIIGIINLMVLIQLYQLFRKLKSGAFHSDELETLLNSRGLIARMISPLLKFISRSWHVYPLGFLFGLGFDTATEVGLLAISAGAAKNSISVFGILSLPLLFAAGMSLMDTADGMFMTKAYRWAFSTPLRKIYYNVTVTAISVVAALLIGVVELLQVLSERLQLQNGFFQWVQHLDFGSLGFALVGLFLAAWIISVTVWKVWKVEERYNVM
ncbi:HoxN/HupN/NixA family nickel/cobalt transporter [Paenibacillus filicis]|uniref:Nickel/cobalt efflux system n=1 Tax=Paenibacillus gyeongsangnamensis TaxID=3388067 RepID=A0ABT4Q5Q6_9BACL|nr:HoxN/HupN/NixA family nickel/cobalt transporter [Paenibacillus filicis]MCZ8512217.1 HoxN/HupN/NixA family nickel/cobalt transporter [Paenibacillus filicis]